VSGYEVIVCVVVVKSIEESPRSSAQYNRCVDNFRIALLQFLYFLERNQKVMVLFEKNEAVTGPVRAFNFDKRCRRRSCVAFIMREKDERAAMMAFREEAVEYDTGKVIRAERVRCSVRKRRRRRREVKT
jgi:hypothetical protein